MQARPGGVGVSGGQGGELFVAEGVGVAGGLPVGDRNGGEGLARPTPGVGGGEHQAGVAPGRQRHLHGEAAVGVGVGEGGFGAVHRQAQLVSTGPSGAMGNLHNGPPRCGMLEGSLVAAAE